MKEQKTNGLTVRISESRQRMGEDAATMVKQKIEKLLAIQPFISMIFAAAPSQNEFLDALVAQTGPDWKRVNAFHMDEYVGLEKHAPQLFANYLKSRIFEKLPFRSLNFIDGNATDPAAECSRYARLLQEFPPDIVCLGIGENTHIAFNDPHVADFGDPVLVKIVELDLSSRQQQVNDGCFANLNEVPSLAITLTVPALFAGKHLYCIVPGPAKARAVFQSLNEQISPAHPATILRRHQNAVVFLDGDSSKLLDA